MRWNNPGVYSFNPETQIPMKRPRILLSLMLPVLLSFGFIADKKSKLLKKHLANYSLVEKGTTTIANEMVEVDAFLMSKTEVSNLDYQEFLHDLLRQGRHDALEIARVRNENWNDNAWSKTYHVHPAYHDYPVVNISHAAAKLYCQWLTEKNKRFLPSEDSYYRLPTKEEWVRAAKGRHLYAPYPWGGYYLRNAKGCLLANFRRVGAENISFDEATGKYSVIEPQGKVHPAQISAPSPIDSYVFNDFELYNMSGNVAEMVATEGIAMGGSWRSAGYDIRTESEIAFDRPMPTVGFRPVLIMEEPAAK